ncbi:retrotransposon protein, putative, ty1-copia subclass [Tanacetum coccineum]
MGYYFYYPPENKIFVARYDEFFKSGLILQEVSGENVDLEVIQDEDAQPSKNTREHHNEVEHDNFKQRRPLGANGSSRKRPIWMTMYTPLKARIVAKAYTQTYWVDHEETFSHVAKIRAIRILIGITTFYDYEIWQMDVKTAFLNSHLNEDVYMVQPEGFVDPKYPRRVQPSIYGLK